EELSGVFLHRECQTERLASVLNDVQTDAAIKGEAGYVKHVVGEDDALGSRHSGCVNFRLVVIRNSVRRDVDHRSLRKEIATNIERLEETVRASLRRVARPQSNDAASLVALNLSVGV